MQGSFDRTTGALRLEGAATHPDDRSPVPFVIEGWLLEGEITVATTFALLGQVNWGTTSFYRI